MKVWLLTLLILALATGAVDLVQKTVKGPYWYRVLMVVLSAAFLSVPTAMAVALVGR